MTDPDDRPASIFGGKNTLYAGGKRGSYYASPRYSEEIGRSLFHPGLNSIQVSGGGLVLKNSGPPFICPFSASFLS